MEQGDCYTEHIGGKWGAIDPAGNIVVPIDYDETLLKNDHVMFRKGNEEFRLLHDGEGHYRLEK